MVGKSGVENSGVEMFTQSLGLMLGVEKSRVEMSSEDISTMNNPTLDFSTPDLGLESLGLRSLGLKSSWLKSLGLKSSWLKCPLIVRNIRRVYGSLNLTIRQTQITHFLTI